MNITDQSPELRKALLAVSDEAQRAQGIYGSFTSAHEGYAVLLEEVDELWQHVKVKRGQRLTHAMRAEAIQIAAMAVRFIIDLT